MGAGCEYICGTHGSGVVSSADDAREIVRGVGVWALPILWEQGGCGTCVWEGGMDLCLDTLC